ncbi:MAG: hypothetical protein GWO41_05880 [candidate division Zixibacteria bacterium]|nr:hypothetical protein [candidate division Zixibacteria bacterium]NIR64225.1 hypothetical protein [candidate division Zixibacteria bacterium]NIS15791.1 hypothetical protein [candidate division Zixibacteria bacterium]NIS46125.1 hypothetical protein [candidate division Zixibacteria bacterium]NIT52272.1 hypothetical protein [candidate division Zixibacteria bacterium]
MNKLIIVMVLTLAAFLITFACDRSVDPPYTNPAAIMDLLEVDELAQEAEEFDFIDTGSYTTLADAQSGDFGTTQYKLEIDSALLSYRVDVGDTVLVDAIWAKEAYAYSRYQIFYKLTLKNEAGDSVMKHLVTDSTRARKRHYLLKLGQSTQPFRGWVYWGTNMIFNLSRTQPNIRWFSEEQGELPNSNEIIRKTNIPALKPGDRITVQYQGLPSDIGYLNINETGTTRRIKFTRVNDVIKEAEWTVSSNYQGKDHFYYAGVEIYRYTTLGSADTTDTDFLFMGLMYPISDQ